MLRKIVLSNWMKNTLIKNITFFEAGSSWSAHISDSTHSINEIRFIVAEIELESGHVGQGYLLSFNYSPNGIKGVLKDIKDFTIKNYHVFETLKLGQDFERETEYFGSEGLNSWAIGIINIAMWDAWGKMNNLPVWQMLGGHVRKIPVYGSGGWLSYSNKELIEEVLRYKSMGLKAVKIKVGSGNVETDIERLRKVREAVGNGMDIMIDANQGMSVGEALNFTQKIEKLNIHWFEEPVHNKNFYGYSLIRRKSNILLAMGEREYNMNSFKELIARNAIDLWQPDLIRLGGVEGWRNSAVLANGFNIPVIPHYYIDYDIPLLCTIPNGLGAELFNWIDDLIDNELILEDGQMYPRETPGWGFSFLKEKLSVLDI